MWRLRRILYRSATFRLTASHHPPLTEALTTVHRKVVSDKEGLRCGGIFPPSLLHILWKYAIILPHPKKRLRLRMRKDDRKIWHEETRQLLRRLTEIPSSFPKAHFSKE